MLEQVERGGIDQVLAESTCPIARNQRDARPIRELVNFAGARIFTLADGEINALTGGIKGLLDEQQRKDLGHNIRRAQRGRATQGLSPAGIAYSYHKVLRFDDGGRAINSLREIDPETAPVVERIFTEYAAGRSARRMSKISTTKASRRPAAISGRSTPFLTAGRAATGSCAITSTTFSLSSDARKSCSTREPARHESARVRAKNGHSTRTASADHR